MSYIETHQGVLPRKKIARANTYNEIPSNLIDNDNEDLRRLKLLVNSD